MSGDVVSGSGAASERPLPPVSSRSSRPPTPGGEGSGPLPPFFSSTLATRDVPQADSAPTPPWQPEEPAPRETSRGPEEGLARRLERLATRLRSDGAEALADASVADPLDALLAGVLAGYLAGRRG